MNGVFEALFFTLMAMVLVWLFLITSIFKRLKTEHTDKYQQLGKPGLFSNNSIKTGYATLKFFARREHITLDDPFLSKLSDFALNLLIVYVLLFFNLVVNFILPMVWAS